MYQPGSLSVGQGLSCVWIHDSLYEGVEWEVLDSPLHNDMFSRSLSDRLGTELKSLRITLTLCFSFLLF